MALYDWGDGHGKVHSRPKKNGGGTAGVVGGSAYGGRPTAQATGGGYGAGANALPGVGGVQPGGQGPKPVAPPPPDPAYEAYKAQQGLQAGISNADATYQRGNLGYESGYGANGARDYTNPYSQAALYEESYKRSKLGTTNSYASQGQLYSGAYGRMQGENARNESINQNSLAHQAAAGYHGIDVNQASNSINYGSGNVDQGLAALLKALGIGS